MKTPEEIKKGLETCVSTSRCDGCPYFCVTHDMYGCEEIGCNDGLLTDALALIQRLEAERDELKDALGLMVYQYCVRGDKLDHMYMCAGENAFRALGLEQYGDANTLEGWLFPEPSKEE